MEVAMYKCVATITGTLAILAAALLASDRAEAGASASAPSKYAHTSHVAADAGHKNVEKKLVIDIEEAHLDVVIEHLAEALTDV
jgi:ABC-type glycerol-3-phosphate transport system substrate-binding protein